RAAAAPYGVGPPGAPVPDSVWLEPPPDTYQRWWLGGEYLLWWIKDPTVPVPLVTTSTGATAAERTLGSPGTVVLFGGSDLDYGGFSGARLAGGVWLDHYATVALEGRGFVLDERSLRRSFASNGAR